MGYPEVLVFPQGLSNFLVLTDHRPLEGIFQKDLFDLPSPRLQRMREKIAMYNFVVQWTPGKTHLIADALSRAPLFAPKDLSCLSVTSSSSLDIIFSTIDEDYRLLLSDVLMALVTQITLLPSSLTSILSPHQMVLFYLTATV